VAQDYGMPATVDQPARHFLLRHGQSEANVQRLIASSPAAARDAFGLTTEGREQVRASVLQARERGVLPPEVTIFSSPLLRARETAAIAAEVLGATVRIDDRLIERGFGTLELASDEHYDQVWSADRSDPAHVRWGVESTTSILARVTQLLLELDRLSASGAFVLCTHGDVASVTLCAASGLPLTQHREIGAMGNGEVRPLSRSFARQTGTV
jgi:probable phosphoglycerate mutase